MKVKVYRSEEIDTQYTDVEISDCTAVEAVAVLEAMFNPVSEDFEVAPQLLH